jgi:hypothetical protein
MPVRIPFQPSQNNYRMKVPIDNEVFLFDVRWNDKDSAWYFDLYEEDETLILASIKVVLGAVIGQLSTNAFFQGKIFTVIDTANTKKDAGYDDLGARIQLVLSTDKDLDPDSV